MGINPETQINKVKRVVDFGVLSLKWLVSSLPSLRAKRPIQKRRVNSWKSKVVDDHMETVCSRHNWTDAHMNSHISEQQALGLYSFKLDRVSVLKGKETHAPIPSPKAICH